MTLNKKYKILPTTTFKEELEEIIYYIKYNLKEPLIAKNLYKKIINEISSLQFMPERHKLIEDKNNNLQRNLRKILINNYVIIFEIKKELRSNFYSTYFS